MTDCIRFFYASLLLCAAFALSAETVELQFIPGEQVRLSSVASVLKEVKVQGVNSAFFSHQGVEALLYLDEGHPAKFPLSFQITLEKIKSTLKNNENQITFDSEHPGDCLEMAEAKVLLGRPLKFGLKNLQEPLLLDCEQAKLLGELALFNPSFIEGLFEDDLKNLFALSEQPLSVGSVIRMQKKIDKDLPVEYVQEYTITEINPQYVVAELSCKVDRKKVSIEFQFDKGQEKQPAVIVLSGEGRGIASWGQKNGLNFNMVQTSSFKYSIKALGIEAHIALEIEKEVRARPLDTTRKPSSDGLETSL